MQRLPEEERRIVNGISVLPIAWDKAMDHAAEREVSVSRLIEGLVLGLPDIAKGEEMYEWQDVTEPV